MTAGRFINDLFVITNRMPGKTIMELTSGGHDANLWESTWRSKGKRHLAYTIDDTDEYVVTDIVILPEDKDRDMDDYASLLLTKDTNEKGLKKHILYYRRDSRKTATKAIEQIMLINPSKGEMVQAMFTAVSYHLNEILITFKTADIPKGQPALPNIIIPKELQTSNVPSSPMPPSGIEGIPFQINPKYGLNRVNTDPVIGGISIISLADINEKYNYAFSTEKRVIDGSAGS